MPAVKKQTVRTSGEVKTLHAMAQELIEKFDQFSVALAALELPEQQVQPKAETEAVPVPKEEEREERFGVRVPAEGGVCRKVWDALDAMVAKGEQPDLQAVRKLAKRRRWNQNNARVEFYQWRKFHGISRPRKK